MSAYDDSYEIADLEKEFPNANYSELRRILSERSRQKFEKWREEDEAKYGTPLYKCPTTGKTCMTVKELTEILKKHGPDEAVLVKTITLPDQYEGTYVHEAFAAVKTVVPDIPGCCVLLKE